ncbi:MAG: hypothetical protein MI723_19790, partial [Caulobacterales bacterium]|nr:hypothetical protein [Caulobacterales bacterium]
EVKIDSAANDSGNLVGAGRLTDLHVANFLDAVREGAEQASPIDEGHKSTLLCHLANIAYRTGAPLTCDPATGRPDAEDAMALWRREYEPGWELAT